MAAAETAAFLAIVCGRAARDVPESAGEAFASVDDRCDAEDDPKLRLDERKVALDGGRGDRLARLLRLVDREPLGEREQ